MTHEMKLNEKPFYNIDKGIKKIELRLFDEKRAKINLNDYILFRNTADLTQTLKVKVIGLLRYNSFEDLFKAVDFNICGPANSISEKLINIHKIYSEEEEKKYGILAIHIEKI